MVPHWCAHFPECWQQIVAKWLSDDWNAVHQERREHRLTMAGVPHHQGNRNLTEYAQAWVRDFTCFVVIQLCMISHHLVSRSRRHMEGSSATNSWRMLYPTRVKRHPASATTRRTGPRRTATRASILASMSTHRWRGRCTAKSTIRPRRILTLKLS
jgi:hypothetical protein